MINIFIEILDQFFRWLDSLSFNEIVSMYWFVLFVSIPRYYLLEWIVLFRRFNIRKRRKREEQIALKKLYLDYPFVSIIAPGKNEGDHIYMLSKSLREQTFKNFELVIINDGSNDYSEIICKDLLKSGYIDRFLSLELGGGKASAANLGIDRTNAKFIVHLDADSSLDRNALEQILMPFYLSNKIKAVGGCIKVRNDKASICTRFQALEYIESIMIARTVNSDLGILRTISGAFGAFEIGTLKSVGAWDVGPGLDGDITQKIRKAGWKVVFNHKAICLTNVPTRFSALFKQRFRWSRSLVRFRIRKHRDVLGFRSANFRISNFISNWDNILFNFVLDYLWLYYIITIITNNIGQLGMIIALNIIIMGPMRLISFLISMSISERYKSEFLYIMILFFSYIYKFYFLRVNRILAGISELFFFTSYSDPWNPKKTSFQARINKM